MTEEVDETEGFNDLPRSQNERETQTAKDNLEDVINVGTRIVKDIEDTANLYEKMSDANGDVAKMITAVASAARALNQMNHGYGRDNEDDSKQDYKDDNAVGKISTVDMLRNRSK